MLTVEEMSWRVQGVTMKKATGFKCLCPCHADSRPSLKCTLKGGKWLFYCFAGCSYDDIVTALELETADIFEDARQGYQRRRYETY